MGVLSAMTRLKNRYLCARIESLNSSARRECERQHYSEQSTTTVYNPIYNEVLQRNAHKMIPPSLRLRRAIHSADTSLVSRILHSHPLLLQNPDTSSVGISNTSLHLSSSLGHASIVSLLLSLGHDKTPSSLSLNELQQTSLHLASTAGHTEVVHLLVTACPWSIARKDRDGRDALMLAAREGHDTVVQILLTYYSGGAAKLLAEGDKDGNTALHFASSNGHLLVLRTLLAAGADSEKRNCWSWTPVAYSATVQAEVYFKGLVAEVERRNARRKEVVEEKRGGAVRLVSLGDGEEM